MEISIIKDLKDLDGFDQLNIEDKSDITKHFEDKIAIIHLPPPKELSTKITTLAPLKVRRSQLKSVTIPNFIVMFTNADQLTSSKMSELITRIQREKPLIIAVCEIKPKNSKDRTMQDYNIPGYSIHPINLDTQIGRGMAVYIHSALEKSVIEIKPDVGFEEVCFLEVRLRGGDIMLFGSFYRSPTVTETSGDSNVNLNRYIKCITDKTYSHKCLVGDFNFKDINWASWTTFHNEESKEAIFLETMREC